VREGEGINVVAVVGIVVLIFFGGAAVFLFQSVGPTVVHSTPTIPFATVSTSGSVTIHRTTTYTTTTLGDDVHVVDGNGDWFYLARDKDRDIMRIVFGIGVEPKTIRKGDLEVGNGVIVPYASEEPLRVVGEKGVIVPALAMSFEQIKLRVCPTLHAGQPLTELLMEITAVSDVSELWD